MSQNIPGAQFEILIDGKPRSYRDTKATAIEGAEFLKSGDATDKHLHIPKN
jgi:hypothetical protein